jgi:hypothetical protein
VQAAYLTLVQKSSEHHHKSTLELLHLNAFNTLPLFLTMSLVLGEPASVSASLLTEDLSFYVVFIILIRKFKKKSWNVRRVRFIKKLDSLLSYCVRECLFLWVINGTGT